MKDRDLPECLRLVSTLRPRPQAIPRDAALLLLVQLMPYAKIVSLDWAHVNCWKTITGGAGEAALRLPKDAAIALELHHACTPFGEYRDPIFCSFDNRTFGHRLTVRMVEYIVGRHKTDKGVTT